MNNRILDMKNDIVKAFKNDGYSVEYAKEYGVNEIIDGFLYYNFEGKFNDEEVEQIMEILNKEFNL